MMAGRFEPIIFDWQGALGDRDHAVAGTVQQRNRDDPRSAEHDEERGAPATRRLAQRRT
jgi:hypothetical protein